MTREDIALLVPGKALNELIAQECGEGLVVGRTYNPSARIEHAWPLVIKYQLSIRPMASKQWVCIGRHESSFRETPEHTICECALLCELFEVKKK